MFTVLPIISQFKYICEHCHVNTNNKKDYNKHLATRKHINVYKCLQDGGGTLIQKFVCDCGKEYKYRQSLCVHRKSCKFNKPSSDIINIPKPEKVEKTETEIKTLTDLVLELVKSNQDLQKQMLDVCKNSNSIINNNNSHNKTFNMNLFLNEKCKDAMNIMDFVNSMTLEFSDLEEVGKVGYVEGISNIIIRKLNAMDIYKRPIHCSDAKREIMFVKDENIWEKENSTYDKLRKAIKHVTYKNSSMLEPWSKEHPQCMNTSHHLNDVYVQMIGQCMGGKESFVESENKIMKKIAKAVLINKS
jgi:hypothetical protein